MRTEGEQVTLNQFLCDWVHHETSVSRAVAPRTASSPGSPKATGTELFFRQCQLLE